MDYKEDALRFGGGGEAIYLWTTGTWW